MATNRLPALQRFIDDVRALYDENLDHAARFERAKPLLERLLEDATLKERAASWPSGSDHANQRYQNLLFYVDPDFGFAINALVKDPDEQTPIHDHGESWTLYGVLEGGETVVRYRRADDGADETRAELELVDEHKVTPGFIDFVPPGEAHAEYNGPQRTVGVILRSRRLGNFQQNWFNPETGAIQKHLGPEQVPYALN
jgi:predicted metal-dependent enzyme (double-stranded beta helix superfamily)